MADSGQRARAFGVGREGYGVGAGGSAAARAAQWLRGPLSGAAGGLSSGAAAQ
ncbi:hypothetical protein [Streptomyces sp. NPDC059452]|uniref:hypothetical protein n=1 Tax=Streptomyces sp. NPDC059452 TaxID=3346835 RepID=UPI0036A0DB52